MGTADHGSEPKPPPLPRRGPEPAEPAESAASTHLRDLGTLLGPDDGTPAAQPASDERRAHRRIELQAEVNFVGHDNFYTGFAEDISNGGLFVTTYQLKPTGTEVDINFSLPDGTEIITRAVVRWIREPRDMDGDTPPGMGLQFVDLDSAQKEAVETFILRRDPLFYED